jgi:hypothetical protein
VIFAKEKPPEILRRPSVPRVTTFSSSEGDVACTSAHYEFGGSSRDGDGCSIPNSQLLAGQMEADDVSAYGVFISMAYV